MFKELEKNYYRVKFIDDEFKYNGTTLPALYKYSKRHEVFTWKRIGIDLSMIYQNCIVRLEKFKRIDYVRKSWQHRIRRFIYTKTSFARGRKIISCIYKSDRTTCKQEQRLVRSVEILPTEVIMNVIVQERRHGNNWKYRGKICFEKLRRSPRRLCSIFFERCQFKLPILNM